jgi:hypothetical protein
MGFGSEDEGGIQGLRRRLPGSLENNESAGVTKLALRLRLDSSEQENYAGCD